MELQLFQKQKLCYMCRYDFMFLDACLILASFATVNATVYMIIQCLSIRVCQKLSINDHEMPGWRHRISNMSWDRNSVDTHLQLEIKKSVNVQDNNSFPYVYSCKALIKTEEWVNVLQLIKLWKRSLHNFCLTTTRLRFVKVVKSLAKIALEGEINNTGYYRPQMSHRWVENYTLKNVRITAKLSNILSRERQTNCRLFQLIHIFLWNKNYASVKKTGKPTMLHKKSWFLGTFFGSLQLLTLLLYLVYYAGLFL